MLFINFQCLLYLMVLADSHTISKSIDNDNKLDNNIFESIHDVDRPINPKTRKDRQHKYKLYYSKDEDVVLPDSLKGTPSYAGLEKTTATNQLLTLKATTDHAKHHKAPNRRVGSFWRKLRGKDKKKESYKDDYFDRKRRISNYKKEPQKDSTNPGPRIKDRRKNRKQFSLRQPEIKVTKRDVSGLFSTRPYCNTPQSHQLQMGITQQVDNMLKMKYRTKPVQPYAVTYASEGMVDRTLQGQLENILSKISDLKEKYGGNLLELNKTSTTESSTTDTTETNKPSPTTAKETVTTTDPDFQGTAEIELMLNDIKAKAIHMISFQKPLVSDLIGTSVTEATYNTYPVRHFSIPGPSSGLTTFTSINDNEHLKKTTVTSTKSDEFNLNDSIFSSNTESHYLAARSIKEDTMTIAQNVEDMLQRELKNLYNKVKHRVSNDLNKEIHTVKSTAKESYEKISSKLSSKSRLANASSTAPSTTTSTPKYRTRPSKTLTQKKKEQSFSSTTTTTTAPRLKKDDTVAIHLTEPTNTPESVYKQTYDDYMMLTLFEQILSKTHEENVRKMLATTEFPVFPKIKRETFRLSKRNPETLTDVKLREVIQNLYDDGGNMPDYDYIDPSANVSSTEKTTANNVYNDGDYVIDSTGTTDNSADGSMVEINAKNKGTPPAPTEPDHVTNAGHIGHTAANPHHNTAAETDNSAADSDNTALDTSYEGLSSKISFNEFVNGYKHYLNFQKDQNKQNFSNMIKYQAHKHHSVDDIGKYILNKIPPLPSHNKKKREQRFFDDSENNMDYQEITTKNDDSWFRKHFYLFIDNGPPKKYHTSETVELKPPSTESKLFLMTEPTPGVVPEDQIFIRIGSDGVARKAKHTQEISLDDLSKVLDSIKDKQTGDTLSKATPNKQKDTFNPIENHNITNDATSRDKSLISKFFAGKRRHAFKKDTETTKTFPNYMFAVNTWGRSRRSITKQYLENTLLPDFINKDIEEKASSGTKEVLANAAQFSNRETNKYGYVDMDLVPRQTAIVKLRVKPKKSRFKNFFKKFKLSKKKAINPKQKRFCPQNFRTERFNPIKKLKSIFKYREEKDKEKEEATPDRLHSIDYDLVNSHLRNYKPMKFAMPLSVDDMRKQIPNISDVYFEPALKKSTTTKVPSKYFHLDDKDEDLLYNFNPLSSSSKSKSVFTTQQKPGKLLMSTTMRKNATTLLPSTKYESVLLPSSTKQPDILRIPPSNIMTVNVKTMPPSTTSLKTTESTSLLTYYDMGYILDKMQKKIKSDPEKFPKVTKTFTPSHGRSTEKHDYKKNILAPSPLIRPLEELLIRSKLTRIAKFPIKKRLYKIRNHDDSGLFDNGKDYLGFDGPSVLEYLHDLGSQERRKSVKGNTLKKLHHFHAGKTNDKHKSKYTDYFNDLLMWHNDILNLDTVPNTLWENILKTVHTDTGNFYTTPNMKSLLMGLKEMNDYLDPGDNATKSTLTIPPNKPSNERSKEHVGVRHVKHRLYAQPVIRRVALDDKAIVTSNDMIIKGEAMYYQYNKPRKIARKLNSRDFITKSFRLHVDNYNKEKENVQFKRKGGPSVSPAPNNSEAGIIVDTTLMAYDDDVDSVTKTLAIKKQSRNSKIALKAVPKNKSDVSLQHSTILKTNKPPMQYYTTPLPMKSRDFNKFLKENQMDVDFVTAPILELPTIKTTQKKHRGSLHRGNPSTFGKISSVPDIWKTQSPLNIPSVTEIFEPSTTTKRIVTTTKKKGFTEDLRSKIQSFTKALGKSIKFATCRPKAKPKLTNSSFTDNNIPDWVGEFDRYKRYSELKLSTNTPIKRNTATQVDNYYSIFKRKMKEKLFEKKETGLSEELRLDRRTTDAFTVNPHNKEVEITIINFDDIEKMTTHLLYDPVTLPTLSKEEINTISNYGALPTVIDSSVLSTDPPPKEQEIHNGLLYKDILKDQTTSSTTTTEFTTLDLKTTEYITPIVTDGRAIISNKPVMQGCQFEKLPIYPSILRKVPHGKNSFNSIPKRVHISSHHYKYDVFYDDTKRTFKTLAIESLRFRPKHSTAMRPIGIRSGKRPHKRISTIWWREAPHKSRKRYTFKEWKSKPNEGLNETTSYYKTPIILTALDYTADGSRTWEDTHPSALITTAFFSEKPYQEPFLSAVDKSTEVSWIEKMEPLSDIEDVVTMLDRADMGVTMSYIEDAVTLSAIRSEFFTSANIGGIGGTVRRALLSTSPARVTNGPTKTTTPSTKFATKPTTKAAHAVEFTPQPSSLIYLKQPKPTMTSSKPCKDKKLPSHTEKDRQRRLFKISALLQNRFKSLMRNFTTTTKLTNATTNTNGTTQSSNLKAKRTCDPFLNSPRPYELVKEAATKKIKTDLQRTDVTEGFRVTYKPERASAQILMKHPCDDDSGEVTPATVRKHKFSNVLKSCDVYVEPDIYNDQLYYEMGPAKCPDKNETTTKQCESTKSDLHSHMKREAQLNTFTAKDVAALEVIVDLMKNTLSYEDNNIPNIFHQSNSIIIPTTRRLIKANNNTTNSIQVHIEIPFDFQYGKKRSPYHSGPIRVRKVFSAKMSTPVDLEYQVHSFEATIAPTSTKPSSINNSTDDGLTPGMYLLIDRPKDGYALKPVLGQINLTDLKAREAATESAVNMMEMKPTDTREETTSLKSMTKVTLSKDFLAVVNDKLIEMYENITRVDKAVNSTKIRSARSVWNSRKLKEKKERKKRNAEKYIVKRRIDWEAVKHFFGHDRVCNCKCKSNKTMCRACAASDAVIDELIFEFDNIGQYMADHCTEIQTFFWMNPIGGQRLRESVNKIDKSLSDYYKRVKGKCQGRLCKTFSTCSIDNTQFTKVAKTKKEDSMSRLINDLAVLAEDLNKTVSLKVCYSDKLKENGDKFLHLMNNCIMTKFLNKRSNSNNPNTTPKKLIKHVYSLDNINVNIICNPESSTPSDEHLMSATITSQDNPRLAEHLSTFNFDLEETTKHNKGKGFKKLFPRKNKKSKLFSYFEFNKGSKANYKREVDNQVATPLISDGGGAFWYDYLKSGTNEPRLVRDSIKDTPNMEIAVVQKRVTTGADLTVITSNNDLAINTIDMTVQTAPGRNQRDIENTTEIESQIVEDLNKNSTETIDRAVLQDKPKKQSLTIVDKVKEQLDKAFPKDKLTTTTKKIVSTIKKKTKEMLTTIKHTLKISTKKVTAKMKAKDDILVISTKMTDNATSVETTTEMTPVTDQVNTTTYSAETNYTTNYTTILPNSYDITESMPIFGNEASTKLGFMKKLKAATLLMFRKEQTSRTKQTSHNSQTAQTSKTSQTAQTSQTPKQITETPTQSTTVHSTQLTSSTSAVTDIVADANKKVMDYVIEESVQSTTQNPTILIINDYGNDISSGSLNDKAEYRNLLLSIIQFETNSLNDEWDRVAYGDERHRDESDIKRSIVTGANIETDKQLIQLRPKTKPPAEVIYEQGLDQDKPTQQPGGLLNKIVSKMGIKVVNNKKKVVKKASIRELTKDRKKGNFIKNRKLRINSYRQTTSTPPETTAEACHTRRPTKSSEICDIQATYDHIKKLQKSLPGPIFETLMGNMTCYKYRNTGPIFTIPYKKSGKRWDWIRKKRSLKLHFYNRTKDEHNVDDDAFVGNLEDDDSTDSFERFAKGDDGIYKIVNRRKRTTNLETLECGLRNIPPLVPGEDEVFVMLGDSVTLDCGRHTPVRTCDGKFMWKTDRKRMLKQDNVYVDGVSVTIHNVEPRNVGTYTCSLDRTVRRNVRLNVLTVPSFDVVFLPVYKAEKNCSYDDLIAIQKLGSIMANESHCGTACSIRIDEPVCQRDKGVNSTMIRATAVISMTPLELNCSMQCKRDIVSSLVLLCAKNTAILSSIDVLVTKDGVNETLKPWNYIVRPIVTHTLRKKDTNGHHEYNKLVPLLAPGKVDVVLICPAGYYLLPKYKLCSSCPPDTSSKAGDNACYLCPRGSRTGPGAAKCNVVKSHPRRYDWWWYPPCGYVVACCGVLLGCSACVLLSVTVHVVSRDADRKQNENGDNEEQKILSCLPHVTVAQAHAAGARPLSPSRVILPRFFRPSLTSSRATDSQETKFELWKERNRPPPLPPIDFDP